LGSAIHGRAASGGAYTCSLPEFTRIPVPPVFLVFASGFVPFSGFKSYFVCRHNTGRRFFLVRISSNVDVSMGKKLRSPLATANSSYTFPPTLQLELDQMASSALSNSAFFFSSYSQVVLF